MTAPAYDQTIPAPGHGGRFQPDPPAFDVWHSTEGPMADGNAEALARNWFGRPESAGGAGTSTTGIFDPTGSVRMLDEHTVPYHVGPVANDLCTGDELCGSVGLTPEQWMSARGQAMIERAAKVKAQRAIFRGWSLADCRWLSLTEVARRTVRGFCTHNDVRLALGGTTHSDPGPNFPYAWAMGRVRYWFQFLTGTLPKEDSMADNPETLAALADIKNSLDALYRIGFAARATDGSADATHEALSIRGVNAELDRQTAAAGKLQASIDALPAALAAALAGILNPAPTPTPAPAPTPGV